MHDKDRGAVGAPERLKLRRDFLAAAKGVRAHSRAFTVHAVAPVGREADHAPRFGFTATKKIGGATERNRIRRRLREAVRLMADSPACGGHDYVIFAKREALSSPFRELAEDLRRTILSVHVAMRSRRATRPNQRKRRAVARDEAPSGLAEDKDQAIRP